MPAEGDEILFCVMAQVAAQRDVLNFPPDFGFRFWYPQQMLMNSH
jgi:hypothetical protein